MQTQPLSTNGTNGHDVEALIRLLVMRLTIAENPIRSDTDHVGAPDVLLDVVLDDIRFFVVREPPRGAGTLSPREREIARMVAGGQTNKTIAAVLEISLWTVSTHLRRIFAKLGVSTRAAMVARLAEPSGSGLHPRDGPGQSDAQPAVAT